ncbi:hypothetical protein MMC30_001721 [Trapelia coarctata]|nr:hypothetical protein [Trapelia coarctata]
MPKKHKKFQYSKPVIPVHPSLSSSPAPHHGAAPPDHSTGVNDLIQQSRRSQAPSALGRDYNDSNPHPTVHPSLKAILQLPDTPAPLPRMSNPRSRRQRGPAGPPPPRSWLLDSIHAPRSVRKREAAESSDHMETPRLDRLPGTHIPDDRSLMHQTFKALASDWTWHIEYDQYYLPGLPDRLKEALLSYIAVYSPDPVTRAGLDLLFLDPSALADATGSDSITHLDLSGASIKDFTSIFTPPAPTSPPLLSASTIPESWDTPLSSLPSTITPTRFPSLTHLSLASSPYPSWRNLLTALPHLAPLTHLSLAHWPPPTLTPNALTATTGPSSSNPTSRPPVPYSASDYYTAAFGDWKEAASILRRLGKGTLCLKWLDLEGCTPWLDALLWHSHDDLSRGGDGGGVQWLTSWRGIETVRVGQAWLPSCLYSDPQLPDPDPKARVRALLEPGSLGGGWGLDGVWTMEWDPDFERRKVIMRMEVQRWLRPEIAVRKIEKRLQRLRWGHGLKAVVFEKTEVEGWVEEIIAERVAGAVEMEPIPVSAIRLPDTARGEDWFG